MYKEVEINTPFELARYLINEGDLYVGKKKIKLTADADTVHSSPFRLINKEGMSIPLDSEWRATSATFYKKLEWYNCIPQGKKVPCFVSDTHIKALIDSGSIALVANYAAGNSRPFIDGYGIPWKYATPVPAYELWVPEL